MLIIKDTIKDMKQDLKKSMCDIQKALKYKSENPSLSEEYYKRSIAYVNNMNNLHDDIIDIIEDYRKTKGEPPTVMLTIWNYEHENLIEELTEIKNMQEYYKSL